MNRAGVALDRATVEIVAIAASAGGLSAISTVLSALPLGLPAAVLVLQHLDRGRPSLLPDILGRRALLPVRSALDGERPAPGCIYVAPPDEHLLVQHDRTMQLTHTALVRYVRPSADLLFESVADAYGPAAVAVVLTGTGSDGSDGVCAIKRAGGTVIAQDEATSEFFGMPGAAIESGSVDYVLPLGEIGAAIRGLIQGEVA
jgi:two-component system chemotaxis response regulator CheB